MLKQKTNYQTGDILLYDRLGDGWQRRWFGKLVQLFNESKYVHTAIYLGEHEDFGSIIAESVASGFLIRVHDNLGDKQLRYKKGLTEGQKDQIIQRSLEMSGYSYGFFDLIKILFYKFTNTRLFPQTYKQLTCTEAIARVYDGLGIKLVDKEDYDLIFPEDIEKSDKLISV